MPSLIAKTPLGGKWPAVHGGLTLSEVLLTRVTALTPLHGQEKSVARVLKSLGLTFPAPNRFVENGATRIVWTGRDQAFLIGPDATGFDGIAAQTDQSDGWAGLALEGPQAADALMRLIPLDLRIAHFAIGHAARAPLNHMSCVIMRTAADRFELLVFRSMAETAWHDITEPMRSLAARALIA